MKSNLEKLSSLERKLSVEIPAQDVQAAFSRAYGTIQKEVTIKGFRKGKAPLQTIRSIYGDKVKQDVLQDLIQSHYQAALNEHNLQPISYPNIEFDPISDNSAFKFSAAFEIRPEVKAKNFEKLPVLKEKMPDIEPRVTETLDNIRRNKATESPILEDRPAQNGDVAQIDFEGFLNGQPFEGGKADDFALELGSRNFIEGFEEGVIGMKPGQSKTLDLKFPDTYGSAELAGKAVQFKVSLKALKKKVLPELNDEFAKALGSYNSLDEFRNLIRDDLRQSEEKRIQGDLKNRVLRALVDRNPVEVPKSLMQEQKQALIEDVSKRIKQQGGNDAEVEEYTKKWDTDLENSAAFMIQSSFLLDSLADEFGLNATDEDVEKRIHEYAKTTGIDLTRLNEFYSKREARSRLAFQITEEKVIQLLLSKAEIREVTAEELPKV